MYDEILGSKLRDSPPRLYPGREQRNRGELPFSGAEESSSGGLSVYFGVLPGEPDILTVQGFALSEE